jgi:hypothetical protein
MLVAGVVVWAGALLDFDHAAPKASAGSSVPQARSSASEPPSHPKVVASRPEAPARADELPPRPSSRGMAEVASTVAARREAPGTVQVIGRAARAVLTVTRGSTPAPDQPEPESAAQGELGEGILSPEYQELEHHYVEEARDGVWAPAHEQSVRALLRDRDLNEKVALVHCQASVCRIVLQTDSNAAFTQLLDVPGLREETALGPQSPYSLRSGQLSVYFHPKELPKTP